jgi:RES domain-containing protein
MQLWRLARAPFAALDGEGARRFGGRWNSPGKAAVYLADHPALAVLEVLVHLDLPGELLPDDYTLLTIETAGASITAQDQHFRSAARTRAAGDRFIETAAACLLSVPSVILPEARNLVLNPSHPQAAQLTIASRRPFKFDPRLLLRP